MFPQLGSSHSSAFTDLSTGTVLLPTGIDGEHLAVHYSTALDAPTEAVLFVHGATFPTMLAFGFEFEPRNSWLTFEARRGRLACSLDFLGFGASSRPLAMDRDPQGQPPIDQAPEAAAQIALAIRYLTETWHVSKIHLVAHSWGTIPAAMFAAYHADLVASLTLFGPVVPLGGSQSPPPTFSWYPLPVEERFQQLQYVDVLPPGLTLLEPKVYSDWTKAFAASGPRSGVADSNVLKIPAGPIADIAAARMGQYPYHPSRVVVPLFVVYGDFDNAINDQSASSFMALFTACPLKWRMRIDHGTHVMHLETNRHSLYQSVSAFIKST